MQSKVKIAGHPLHPMLVGFPIASYVFTFAALIAYAATIDGFWFRLALVANVAAVVTALLAAIPGSIDYASSVPSNSVAKRTGAVHGILNVGALILFAVNLLLLYQQFSAGEPPKLLIGLVLSGGGVIFTLAAGFYGWEMVQRHHIGVQPVADLRTMNHTTSQGVIEEAAIDAGTWMEREGIPGTDTRNVTESQELDQVPDPDNQVAHPFTERPDSPASMEVSSRDEGGPLQGSALDRRGLQTSAREWLAEEARAEEARAAAEISAEASEDIRVASDGRITQDLRNASPGRDLDTGERERMAEDARITARWEATPASGDTGEMPRHH